MSSEKASNETKRIGIVGAGPGGLSCAMLLAHRGFDVTVFEKEETVGGRNARITLGDYKFDTGPTFLMMKQVLDEIFEFCDRKSSDYLGFSLLDPMYELNFADFTIQMNSDKEKMKKEITRLFPGNEQGLDDFYVKEKVRYQRILDCLYRDYGSVLSLLRPKFIAALPAFFSGGTIFNHIGDYFKEEALRVCFTFQSKYLGMSPWDCPAAFTMIPFIEHEFGLYHVTGGLNALSQAMAKVVKEENGEVRTNTKVERLVTSGWKVEGVQLEDGETIKFDQVVLNADFAYAMNDLIEPNLLSKWTPQTLEKKKFSCSTFMLYMGVDKIYDMPHHNIFYADDYRANIADIAEGRLSKDFSFYIQNACVTDDTLAPKGKSTVYVLVPVANLRSEIDWNKSEASFKEDVLAAIEKKTPMHDIRDHIEVEKTIAPNHWENNYNVYIGATFNLAHNLLQMLYFRPHNHFEDLENVYLVGGGTHPGSGLPTIYMSAVVTAGLILKKYGMETLVSKV